MNIAVSSDMDEPVARQLVRELEKRGHHVLPHGVLKDGDRTDWAFVSQAAAEDVAAGRADQAVVCCWTGTGAALAANKVRGIRAALCTDAYTAAGARRWNDANVLAIGLRLTSGPQLVEILDAWFDARVSEDPENSRNIAHIGVIEEEAGR
ncbi:RpiB/LacA/LacB family sugar-phosphate isomerase [Streptomyces caatingaensis]|uniref:Galactose isomerase n=1 Tax=Streptomyces caatingaensis TaxID=1678637 RepID=A0A0K9XLJ1_9ACTN|nr:RpiB/LacA/LacB family sugar-phosphate isomerase [Streptomyces caatingaensis]KNB54118.1 galactose isomerase [Streptomyces caatingaensis]